MKTDRQIVGRDVKKDNKPGVINDPLGQTYSSDHYSRLNFVLFCEILKIGDGCTDVNMCENQYLYRRDNGSAEWINNHSGSTECT